MAFMPYFVLGPTSILGLIGLLRGPDKTNPTPTENWETATLDLLIPTFNEEKTVVLCLSSIIRQTLKPRQIVLIDDASKDRTTQYAQYYADMMGINLKIIKREFNEGKTPSVYQMITESDADVVALIDGDTILESENYLERLIQELYQGVGIACACGFILPLGENERKHEYIAGNLEKFSKLHPTVEFSPDKTWFQQVQRGITNAYREQLYLFLERFIHKGEMVFFGTLIFPVGCAVIYRRLYLKNVFDQYLETFGFDLTTSEDIFFGFAFATEGYRNIVVQDVYAYTTEPRFFKLFKQIFKWSSSFLQCTYYFNELFLTPFKSFRVLIKNIRQKYDPLYKEVLEKRKIKETYRQSFGSFFTKKYGRSIGWFVFTTAFEKVSYPTFIMMCIFLHLWEILFITIAAEVSLFTVIITIMQSKNSRHCFRNFIRAILFSPVRYAQLLFELVVIGNFILDLWVTKNRNWRK